jgi:HEAT repeat protein
VAAVVYTNPAALLKLSGRSTGYQDGQTVSSWIEALQSPDAAVRCQAAHALGALGPDAAEAAPALCRVMREDPKRGPRIEASQALMKMGRAARASVSGLALALDDPEPWVRMNATVALLRLGADARPAIPALTRALHEKRNQKTLGAFYFNIREMAALALGRASSGSPEAVPVLMAALGEAHTQEMRVATTRALGEVGAAAQPAVPLLKGLLRDADGEVREVAAEALQRIERESRGWVETPTAGGWAPGKTADKLACRTAN